MMLGGVRMSSCVSNGEGTITQALPPTPQEALAAGFPWEQAFMPRRWDDMLFANQENNTCHVVLSLINALKHALKVPSPATKGKSKGKKAKYNFPVLVLMGPPGCGKTTILRLLGDNLQVRVHWLNSALEDVVTTVTDVRGRTHHLSLENEVRERMECLCRTTDFVSTPPRKDLIVLDGFDMLSKAERAAFVKGVLNNKRRKLWAPVLITVTTPVPQTFWKTFKGKMLTFKMPGIPRVVVAEHLKNIARVIQCDPCHLLGWLDKMNGNGYGDMRQSMVRAEMSLLDRKLMELRGADRVPQDQLALAAVEKQIDIFQAGSVLFTWVNVSGKSEQQCDAVDKQRLEAASSIGNMLPLMMSANIMKLGCNMRNKPVETVVEMMQSHLEWLSCLDQLPWMRTWTQDLTATWAVVAAKELNDGPSNPHVRQRTPFVMYKVENPFPLLQKATAHNRNDTTIMLNIVEKTQSLLVAIMQRRWTDAQEALLKLGGRCTGWNFYSLPAKWKQVNGLVLPVTSTSLWKSFAHLQMQDEKIRCKQMGATVATKKRKRRTKKQIEDDKRDLQECIDAVCVKHPFVRRRNGAMVSVSSVQVPSRLVSQNTNNRTGQVFKEIAEEQLKEALDMGCYRMRLQKTSWHLYERGFFGPPRFKLLIEEHIH